MSDTSEKSSGTRRRSGTIVPGHQESPDPEATKVAMSSATSPRIVVSSASRPSSSSHSDNTPEFKLPYYLAEWLAKMYHEPEHDTKQDSKGADAASTKVDKETAVTTTKQERKILTDEEEKRAVDEAYKALREEEYTPPSR